MDEQFLVFDIETAGIDMEEFSDSQQEYLLRYAETDEEKEKKIGEMALTPMTAQVVTIGLQLMQGNDRDGWSMLNRAAFSIGIDIEDDEKVETVDLPSGAKCFLSTEKRLLEDFWKILSKYNRSSLVSFNGRNFDAPFLMLRSALLGIRPSRNIMSGTKFNYHQHVDLIDELTYYNPSSYAATRRFNFDFYARAFGITSPKSEGIDGSKVAEYYKAGKIDEVSEYCLRDVNATWELYLKWRELLKF